jgi:hypothetical protein
VAPRVLAGRGDRRVVTAAAWAAPFLILAGVAAYAVSIVARERIAFLRRAARYHLTRRRYARRMRGPLPWWDQGVPYSRLKWLAVLDTWEAPAARPDRSRT